MTGNLVLRIILRAVSVGFVVSSIATMTNYHAKHGQPWITVIVVMLVVVYARIF